MVPAALFGLLAMVGFVVFLGGVSSSDPGTVARTYRVYLHNWLLWAALAQGALVRSSAIRLTNGKWAGPVHRMIDAMGAFVPLSLVLFIVVYVGRHELFGWMNQPVYGK